MSIVDCVIGIYCRVDEVMHDQPKRPQAHLYPSELVTLGLLFALKGVGTRRFYDWLRNNCHEYSPRLPERTRLFRLFATHQHWTEAFLAEPTLLGVADTFGIELRHPWREDRADGQIGGKGLSNHRWIVGVKLAYGQPLRLDCGLGLRGSQRGRQRLWRVGGGLCGRDGGLYGHGLSYARRRSAEPKTEYRMVLEETTGAFIRTAAIRRTKKRASAARGGAAWWWRRCCRC